MSLDIYINGRLIELKKAKTIGLTFQVGSILSPGNRAGNLSNKFSVPRTRLNNEILGHIDSVNSGSVIPYKRNVGKIVQNGIELIPDGIAVVESSGNEYQIVIYSGNVSFFDLIKGVNINQLDWSNENHTYDIPTIISTFGGSQDYIYPMVDWGKDVDYLEDSTLVNADTLIPCVKTRPLLEKIAESVGYKITGNFNSLDAYNRQITSPNKFGYSKEVLAANTGTAEDVTVIPETEIIVEGKDTAGPLPKEDLIPLDYNDIDWTDYSLGKFTATKIFIGNFLLKAKGNIRADIPITGEEIINDTQEKYYECAINDTHIAYFRDNGNAGETDLILYDIVADSETTIATNTGTDLTGSRGLSITESKDGFIAWSDDVGTITVSVYEIATATTTVVYNPGVGVVNARKIKIANGKLHWADSNVGDLFMHDLATATTKTVISGQDVDENLMDHNGEYIVFSDLGAGLDYLYIWDFTTATTTIILQSGALSFDDIRVQGDFATYYNRGGFQVESYKISTNTTTIAWSNNQSDVVSVARTDYQMSWSDLNSGRVYYYNLETDTLSQVAAEINGDVQAIGDIVMNERFVVYKVSTTAAIAHYSIDAGIKLPSFISTSGNILGLTLTNFNDTIAYVNDFGGFPTLNQWRINDSNPSAPIQFVMDLQCISLARDNDRIAFTSNETQAFETRQRASYINTDVNIKSVDYEITILKNGAPTLTQTFQGTGDFDSVYDLTLNVTDQYIEVGDEFEARARIISNRDTGIDYSVFYTLDESFFGFTPINKFPYGAEVVFDELFDFDQSDIFKEVMNQYGLIVQTNEISREVRLTKFDEIQSNIDKAINWSKKVNATVVPRITFKLSGYGQTNYFNYAPDDDVLNNEGRGEFQIEDESIDQVANVITLKSAAVESALKLGQEHTPTIPLSEVIGEYFESKKPRMLLLDEKDKTIDFVNTQNAETGQATTDIPFCYFNKAGKEDNLDFQTILNNSYLTLQSVSKDAKIVGLGVILKELDVQNLDFTIPIELDVNIQEVKINGYFYINKISNFKDKETTSVELIRI
jgi:hypothetical protein